MEQYKYKVYNESSDKIEGEFKGTYLEFQTFIKKRKYILISYKVISSKIKEGKFKNKDFIYFIEELSYLIESGMNIDGAIRNISKNSTKNVQKNFFNEILFLLKEGNQFSVALEIAMKKYEIVIDNLSLLLISTNETIGNLSLGLKKVKEHLEFKEKISSEIKQAMAYPIFLIIMSILMVFFVFLFIVPKFSTIFTPEEFQKLPLLSKIIMEIGLYVDKNINIILILILTLFSLILLFKTKIYKFIQTLIFKLSILRNLLLKLQLSYFFSSLSLMLNGGIDLKTALIYSSNILSYKPLKNLILLSVNELKKGIKLSETFSNSHLISSRDVSLINAGENSSKLSDIFDSLGKRYIEEFKKITKAFLTILEPLIIILMGGVIAIIVISIMLAVMSITDIAQ